jgi:exonuclease III
VPEATAMRVLKEARAWERPSDHVPVIAAFR